MKNLCFKVHLSLYLHSLRTCEYLYCDYPPFPCVLVRQSRVALVDYVSPLWGLNNHVSPRGTWPEKHNPHVQILSFIILLRCKYYIVNIPPFCDLGVIIPIGRDRLCETSMRHYPSRNPIRHWTHKNTFIKPRYFHFLQYRCNYCPFFYSDLGMKIPNGIGGFR